MWQLGFTNSFLLYIFSLFLGQQQPMQQQQQQPMQQQQQPMQQQQQPMQQQPMQQGVKGREVIWAGELCWHENSNPGTTNSTQIQFFFFEVLKSLIHLSPKVL